MNQNRKKLLSMVLAAAMILSVPLSGFAQNPLNNVDSPVPYLQPDTTPPVLHSVSAEKTEVKAGESIFITVDAEDDVTEIEQVDVCFQNKVNGREIRTDYDFEETQQGIKLKLTVNQYEKSGDFELYSVFLVDSMGNTITYCDEYGEKPLDNEIVLHVTNEGITDFEAPKLRAVTLDQHEITVSESRVEIINVSVDAEDSSGIEKAYVSFRNETSGTTITAPMRNGILQYSFKFRDDALPGKYVLERVSLTDYANNQVFYDNKHGEKFPFEEVSFTVVNNTPNASDKTAPVVADLTIDKTKVDVTKEKQEVVLTGDIDETGSGLYRFTAYFDNKETGRTLYGSSYGGEEIYVEISPHEPKGTYDLTSIQVTDHMGNRNVYYSSKYWHKPDALILPKEISFEVINADDTGNPDPEPPVPGYSEDHTGNNEPSNDSKHSNDSDVVNYESEKPNPADKKAVEAYNFWQNAKAKVRTTPDGKTMRLFVPKDITYMPASMMETLYREKITLIITHNGKKIVIPAGKAMPKQKLKVYWTFESLEKLYQA